MIVPDHWAEARKRYRTRGRQITVRRFGWSVLSAADAAVMAERRADEALQRLVAGEPLQRREPKMPYNGAVGVPIREEVLARFGDDVITRNAYGARCLNSPDVLFADVDFEPASALRSVLTTFMALASTAAVTGIAEGSWRVGVGLLVAALALAAPLAKLLPRLAVAAQGGADALARRRVKGFVAAHPEWNVRMYRTPGGLRLLATHRPYHPAEPDVAQFFDAVAADPIYARMCFNQQCFRARLTAKPWRIGIPSHMRPRPGVWPVAPEHVAIRAAWIADYDARARQFASCRYVGSVGSGVVHQRIRPVVELHDRECRSDDAHVIIA